jgi:two-component system nitrate/nitrite response regulator NarL
MKTRILLAGPQKLYLTCLRALLEREADLTVVGEAHDGLELLDLCAKSLPDVVCMDVDMPRMNGIQVTQRIRANKSDVRLIVYSERIDWPTVRAAVEAGADGYIGKSASVENFLRAIRGDASTGRYFCPLVTASVMDAALRNNPVSPAIPTTTQRMRHALKLIGNAAPPARHRNLFNTPQAMSHGQFRDQRITSN